MATSSKVMFQLEGLREQALAAIDKRIADKQAESDGYAADDQIAELGEWRNACVTAIEDIFSRRHDVPDSLLEEFRLPKRPRRDQYAKDRAARELAQLQAPRTRMVAQPGPLAA